MAETLLSLVIQLGYIPPTEVRGNYSGHWRGSHNKRVEMRVSGSDHGLIQREACSRSVAQAFKKVRITFEFHHNRKIDLDNLAIGMKPFVDGLILSRLIEDDDPDHVIYGEHSFTKCKRGESRTIVLIQELA